MLYTPQGPKLSQYIGLERLGRYPPYEFEEIFEARRLAVLNAKADARRRRKEAREAVRQAKRDRVSV